MNHVSAPRLAALRAAMQTHRLDAWIVPTADPHLSEYLPEYWQTRSWLSGFDGSAGTLLVTSEEAVLWTDSRYFDQAGQQLAGSSIALGRLGGTQTPAGWLTERLPERAAAGVAADMLSPAAARQFQAAFAAKGIRLCAGRDIVDDIRPQRPPLPAAPVYIHPAAYAAESAAAKLARVRAAMRAQHADFHLVSALDDIAWITNLRGSDVAYNPVFLAHLLIGTEQATLFTDPGRLSDEVCRHLAAAGIGTAPYAEAAPAVARISGSLMIDAAKTAVSVLGSRVLSADPADRSCYLEQTNPATLLKSCKSEHEIRHIRTVMEADGAALCGFFAELEQKLACGCPLTEPDIDTMLFAHRSRQPGFVSPSFATIAGFNANGALPHYTATPDRHSPVSGNGLLLIDSGGQYLGGTTDITRTVPVGTPCTEQKRDFTLVLKAHIALARAVFPEDLPAPLLDAACRMPLWQAQCDYGHGTGHGVGCFLNVHEGPQSIAYKAPVTPQQALKPGMLTSNEPALYRSGQWGIRTENLILARPVAEPAEHGFGRFLCFETVTLCPIDTRLLERGLLDDAERGWLNGYHAEVRRRLLPHTEGAARQWLLERTEAV